MWSFACTVTAQSHQLEKSKMMRKLQGNAVIALKNKGVLTIGDRPKQKKPQKDEQQLGKRRRKSWDALEG